MFYVFFSQHKMWRQFDVILVFASFALVTCVYCSESIFKDFDAPHGGSVFKDGSRVGFNWFSYISSVIMKPTYGKF